MRSNGTVTRILLVCGALALAGIAHAGDAVVGPGECNENGFADVLANVDGNGGGTITFNCGAAPVTIAFTNFKTIANTVTIDGSDRITFDGGGASAFLQMFSNAHVTLKRLQFKHGAFNASHAIENFGSLSLDHVIVADNTSTESAVMNFGMLQVQSSTFSGNAASSASNGEGGAIGNFSGELHVTASTFNANSATTGAAIYSNGPLTVTNSTFSANAASSGGGAIYQTDSGDAVVEFSTIVGNSALFGAGLYNDGGGGSTLTAGASIVSANSGGNCDGVIASSGYNLSDDMGCGSAFTATGDLINTALPMQALGNYGGPTATQPPQSGNPAIDHVPVSACDVASDQRGGGRPVGSGCDSGAIEVGATLDLIFADGFD